MACEITIDFTDLPGVFMNKLKSKIVAQSGTLVGDENSGTLNVPLMGSHISGSYVIDDQKINITIDHKPFIISCNQIQGYLSSNL